MKNIKIKLYVLFILLFCIITVGCTIIVLEVYSRGFSRVEGFRDGVFTTYLTWNDIDQNKYPRKEVRFHSGRNRLQGFIYGSQNNNGLIVISHGLGNTADSYFPLIMFFVDNGWKVFAFNNTGCGGSEGDNLQGLTQAVIDLDAALVFIRNSDKFNDLPVMLIGHSWGGFAVCTVLNFSHHNVNAVISFSGFNNGRELFRDQGIAAAGSFFYALSFPWLWTLEKQLFGNLVNLTAVDGINRSGIPVMIIHTSDDDVILPHTTAIYAHRHRITNPNAKFILREGDDATGHEFPLASRAAIDYLEKAAASWKVFRAEHRNPCRFQWAEEFGFDKFLANELDSNLMERINSFFIDAK